MHSFKSVAFFIVLLCLTDFAYSLPAPVKTTRTVATKKPAGKKPAAATTKTAAAKPTTTKKATVKATNTPAKKPVTSPKKPATTVKKVATTTRAATASKKPVSTASKKPVTTANPVNDGPKSSNTPATNTKPTTNSTANACPLPKKATPAKTSTAAKAKQKARELMEAVVRLYRRDTFEFVGFHGTNNENGRLYTEKGSLVVPPFFNGNDGELGGGLYVTDDLFTASVFGGSSANGRIDAAKKQGCPLKDTDDAAIAVVCAIEAKSSSTFINSISKLWIPPQEIAKSVNNVNDPQKLAQQVQRIEDGGFDPDNTLRFSVLNEKKPKEPTTANQVMIPPAAFSNFRVAVCVPVPRVQLTPGKFQFDRLRSFAGRQAFPEFNYRDQNQAWRISGNPFGETDP